MRAAQRVMILLGVTTVTLGAVRLTVAADSPPVVTARAAILVDGDTGEVLWQRNPDLPLPPASTTKIVTALLALESGRLHESFDVSREAAQAPPSKISLRPGWQMQLRDLVYAVLLNSANDASVVIAEGLAGSVSEFARRMNAQARRLGARNTHFVNPNGLPAEDHYTTARDLATMFAYALEVPEFARIVATKTASIQPTAGSRRVISLRNHNRLLDDYRIHVVGKTGWTRASKKCFVGAGFADGRRLLVAVLGSTSLWSDLKALLEHGFEGAPAPVPDDVPLQVAAQPPRTAKGAGKSTTMSAEPGQKYAVQLGAFQSLARARRLQTTLARKGFPARITKVRHKRGTLYRVTVGSYSDKREAQQVANRIEKSNPSLKTTVEAFG
jgi:D-alanyl-D-alanine carboxypeptidase (penicillin-binding protein 5/6)